MAPTRALACIPFVMVTVFIVILITGVILSRKDRDTDCGGMFASSTGTIQSPNHPNDYANNLDCVYVITAPEGHRVVLRFKDFSMASCSSLSDDSVEIRDGGNKNSRLLDKYCGTLAPFTVASSGEQMWINFVTDGHFTYSGFLATYTTAAACGRTWTSPTGTIQSPNYPNDYSNNLDCVYVIKAPKSHLVTLEFTSFSLEPHDNCSYDYVKIRDGGSETAGPLGIYCGALSPFTVGSSGNQLWINFVTDTSTNNTGFIATYTTDSVQTGTTSNAATTSRTRITSTSMTAATPSPTRTTSKTRLLTTPSPTTTANTTITTTTTEHVVLTTSKELPFDTDGSQELTLICSFHIVSEVKKYEWSGLTCERQSENTCVFLPKPEDDGKPVTCTLTMNDGGSKTGSLIIKLNYPPQTYPVIRYTKGEVLKAGDDLRLTCSVHGGKPLVKNVIFLCDGHPDTAPDITGQTEVHSVLQFKPVTMEDDGKRCVCTAEWKNTDWYHLSVNTILTVNATPEVGNEEQRPMSGLVMAGAVGIVLVSIGIIVAVVVFCRYRKRNRHPTYDRPDRPGKTSNNIRDPARSYSGLDSVRGQAFVVGNRSFGPIATPDDGVTDNSSDSLYTEIDGVFDASPVRGQAFVVSNRSSDPKADPDDKIDVLSDANPVLSRPSTSSEDSYIHAIDEPKQDYVTMNLPKACP